MSDISRSDLQGIEKQLDRIAGKLDGGLFTQDPARNLERIADRLNDVKSLLQEISRKLEKR